MVGPCDENKYHLLERALNERPLVRDDSVESLPSAASQILRKRARPGYTRRDL